MLIDVFVSAYTIVSNIFRSQVNYFYISNIIEVKFLYLKNLHQFHMLADRHFFLICFIICLNGCIIACQAGGRRKADYP